MDTQLHEALRSLCSNTGWKYAVFWKLKHRARVMLNWEDAYYDKHEGHDTSEDRWSADMAGNLHEGYYSHDPLELAVAKMSYHVYSLGKGIVGQVAITGKHLWISTDKGVIDSCSSLEYCNGWQVQFSAGIKTIVVVGIGQHGVVQLGSLNKIPEDLNIVNWVRDVFSGFQESLVGCIPSRVQCGTEYSSCLSDISTRSSGLEVFHDCICNLSGHSTSDRKNILAPMSSSLKKPCDCCTVKLPDNNLKETVGTIKNLGGLSTILETGVSVDSLQSSSDNLTIEVKKKQAECFSHGKCVGQMRDLGESGVGSREHHTPSQHSFDYKTSSHNDIHTADGSGFDISQFPTDLLDFPAFDNQNGLLSVSEPINFKIERDLGSNLDFQVDTNHIDKLDTSFRFSVDCELYEALGPVFQKQNTHFDWDAQKTKTKASGEMPEVTNSSSLLTSNSGGDYLLEAVVANVCCSENDLKNVNSFCKRAEPHSCNEKVSEHPIGDMQTINSAKYSFGWSSLMDETSYCLNSAGTCGARSSKGFSSSSPSRCSEKLERPQEPTKINKKRARPGENGRPRPRDRQLIQDRIKELRGIIPNGAKCSIDSLLEQTIKHMLFMQSILKHADKLNKCGESKLLDKERCMQGSSSYEQGSSWAVEVGNHLKVCPIMVEDVDMNGLMLVELLCEECGHFLEIAQAIRSMRLTILKGVTEAYGEKTWMCFVVEGQNNRSMHRMDVLWSLVKILQS